MRSPIAADVPGYMKRLLCALGVLILTAACERTTSIGAAGHHADGETDTGLDADAGDQSPVVDGDAGAPTDEELCTSSGGTVMTASCCLGAPASFPDTCSIGSCACAPADSHPIPTCDCPGGCFSPGAGCVKQ